MIWLRKGSMGVCIAGLAWAVGLCGCGRSGPSVYPVTGTVTYNGQTLTTGSVTFVPTAGGPPAEGHIDATGNYSLTTFKKGDGAVPGEHQVMISAHQDNGPNAAATSLLPAKYSGGDSGVSAVVKEEKMNRVDLELTGPEMKNVKPVELP